MQVSERAFIFFLNTTMSEAKETIIIEDESEDDDPENYSQLRKRVLLPGNISFVQTKI